MWNKGTAHPMTQTMCFFIFQTLAWGAGLGGKQYSFQPHQGGKRWEHVGLRHWSRWKVCLVNRWSWRKPLGHKKTQEPVRSREMKVILVLIIIVIIIIVIIYAGSELQKTQFPSRPGGATWGRQIPIKVSLNVWSRWVWNPSRNVYICIF